MDAIIKMLLDSIQSYSLEIYAQQLFCAKQFLKDKDND